VNSEWSIVNRITKLTTMINVQNDQVIATQQAMPRRTVAGIKILSNTSIEQLIQ